MDRKTIIDQLGQILKDSARRPAKLQSVADTIRASGDYRWVGLYEVDDLEAKVSIMVWSGPGAPAHPIFPISAGLTGAAIRQRETINIGDVGKDPRYLTAFGSTRSEIIVPVFDEEHRNVAGTIDVESARENAFSEEIQATLEVCAEVIQLLWIDDDPD